MGEDIGRAMFAEGHRREKEIWVKEKEALIKENQSLKSLVCSNQTEDACISCTLKDQEIAKMNEKIRSYKTYKVL